MIEDNGAGPEWIPAKDCVAMLYGHLGSLSSAVHELKEAAALGQIRARAKVLDVKPSREWREVEPKLNCDVPAYLWAAKRDAHYFDPDAGSYSGRVYKDSAEYSFEAKRVSFNRADVCAFFDLNGKDAPMQEVPTTEAKNRGGAPAKLEAWHKFYMTAMHLLNDGALDDRNRFPNQKALRAHLLSEIDDALSEPSVKPRVSRIWHDFRENG